MELEEVAELGRIVAALAAALPALLEDRLDLLLRSSNRDQPVGQGAGFLGRHRTFRRDQDRGWLVRHRPEAGGLELVVLPVVLDVLSAAAEQLADDLEPLE